VSDLVLDTSLALQWFLEDEADRKYSLAVLARLSEKRALVPLLWFYEIGNGLLMARRKRISVDQIDGFLTRLKALPIDVAPGDSVRDSGAPDLRTIPRPYELRCGLFPSCREIQPALGNE
jgi:predicted nucleic acid-binding protein